MSKVSVIIPARNERFLPETVKDLLSKGGDVEVIAVLDGYWPIDENGDWPFPDDKRLHFIHCGQAKGMRAAINAAANIAKGKYLLKTDAHCMFQEGYDKLLQADCDADYVVIPRRFSLDAEKWAIDQNGKPPRDYHYLCYPAPDKPHDAGMHGVEWPERGRARSAPEYDIDDNLSFQGSCWFMHKAYFWDFLGGMSEIGYGSFTQEPQEIGLKCWLGGGRLVVNKKCWYAHLHKGKTYGRMWRMGRVDEEQIRQGHLWSAKYWMTNAWPDRVHDLEWLIEKFSPVPTWGEDWQKMFDAWHKHYGI